MAFVLFQLWNLRRKDIEKVLRKFYINGMVYSWNDIVQIEGNKKHALTSVKKGKYRKVSFGVYTDDDEYLSELEQLFVRHSKATLTLQSAFEYYGLSDYITDKYYLVTPKNSRIILKEKVSQSFMDNKMIDVGRVKIKTQHGYIYIFDLERMLIELFRLKSKLSHDYFLEVVSSYRRMKSESLISFRKVNEYCKKITYGERILKDIQEMI